MEPNKKTPDIAEQIMEYLDTRIKLGRYKVIEKATGIFASLITSVIVIICGLLAFLFASVTLALYLSALTDSYWEGFGIVTLIYLLLAFFINLLKDRYLEPSIVNTLLGKIFKTKK
ncbi:MAG: phage holin family protein [Sphingobacteriaceae bacterium]